jgi:ubiquinone/menaquinone biosynthesis C-methylase UbiE
MDKTAWFHGLTYAMFVEPFAGGTRKTISDLIEDDRSLIDVGCGPGALVFDLAKKSRRVTGVDVSSKMIDYAVGRKKRGDFPNVDFVHADATKLSGAVDREFDYAVACFVIHGLGEGIRTDFLREMGKISRKLIVADYVAPQPANMAGMLNRVSEILEAKYTNYKSFVRQGGLLPLLEKCGLKIEAEVIDKTATHQVIKASPP